MQVARHGATGAFIPLTHIKSPYKSFFGGKLMYFYWQLLIILFADDKAKNMELHLLVLRERKTIFLVRQISEWQRGAVMAFIPDCRSLVSRPKTYT